MDLAYDQIAADALPKDNEEQGSESKKPQQQASINEELQEAYKAISTSAWGSRLGGFFGTVVKQVKGIDHLTSGHSLMPDPHYRANQCIGKHLRSLRPSALMPLAPAHPLSTGRGPYPLQPLRTQLGPAQKRTRTLLLHQLEQGT